VTLVDGSGAIPSVGNIAIDGDRIAAVGDFAGDADLEIDGTDLVASPGFIDPHSHADSEIQSYPLAENLIMQGITTVLSGNCAQSPAPRRGLTFDAWLKEVEEKGSSINLAPLVGHAAIRTCVMGADFKREATAEEIEEMRGHMDEAMRSGAFGISSFFDPAPGEYASIEEIVELAKIAGRYGGYYVPHTRHIQSQMPSDDPEEFGYGIYHGPIEDVWVGRFRGYMEAIEISKRAGVPLHIAHFSNAYKIPQPHPDFLEEATARATLIEIIDKAREEGHEVTFDVIASSSSISGPRLLMADFYRGNNIALNWVGELERDEFIDKLRTREFRDRILQVYNDGRLKLGMIHTKADPYWMDCFKILSCANDSYEGKTVGEVAGMLEQDALEAIFDMLVEDPDTVWIQFLDRRGAEPAIRVFLKHPSAMPCTDMTVFPAKFDQTADNPYASYGTLPAPIAYGLFPNYIGTYVRERGDLSLEEAVRKATSLPATRFGITDRGLLESGKYADIVIFNLDTIRMVGDFMNPDTPPHGIEYVLVNGKLVYKDKQHTGEKPGKVLRHQVQ
jgi:N-acyl-D-amino-acid deacylase